MRTGVAYMGHHNPTHLTTDLRAMRELQLDDVFVCLQENDFVHFTGKLNFTPQIARDHGVRPLALFWGALNLFGGGRSSQFLLEHPECFQVQLDGSHWPEGCYVNPVAVRRIQAMIDIAAAAGYAGYFVDEPTPLSNCYCLACRAKFEEWYNGNLFSAPVDKVEAFRQRCVIDYIQTMADYCKTNHPQLETFCCLMPHDNALWEASANLATLDNIGTDIYWANTEDDVQGMTPIVDEMAAVAHAHNKVHHEWLQCWGVQQGNEDRVRSMGEVLVRTRPDALYVWAWEAQIGTTESSDDPALCWAHTCDILRLAKAS